MSISEIIEKNYSISREKIQNSKRRMTKRLLLEELIGNIKNLGIKFSIRCLSKTLRVSRKLISSVIKGDSHTKLVETRGRKKSKKSILK